MYNELQNIDKSYFYALGRVSVLSLKLLNNDRLLLLAGAATLEDAVKMLYEINYAGSFTVANPNDFEEVLKLEWDSVTDFLKEESAADAVTKCFLLVNDIHNLKVLTKQKYLKQELNAVPLLKGLFDAADPTNLPKEITEALALIDALEHKKPSVIDALLYKAYYKTVMRLLKKEKNSVIKNYFTTEIDCKNILSFFRFKKAALPKDGFKLQFIEDGSLPFALFEKMFDITPEESAGLFKEEAYTKYQDVVASALEELQTDLPFIKTEQMCLEMQRNIINPHKSETDGILPLINYFLAKKTEIENLRLVLVCVKNKIDKENIIVRLRKSYV